ncbi:hypothetical protein Tco_1573611, partial [Tanacetum coccineum]
MLHNSSMIFAPVHPSSRYLCTWRVGSAHHTRSDGVLVSVPTIAPQGLKILLADGATQAEVSKDERSSMLLRTVEHLLPDLEWTGVDNCCIEVVSSGHNDMSAE